MRPLTMSNPSHASNAGVGKDPKIQSLSSEGAMGSVEVRELVAQLHKELLPSNPVSRSQFLNLSSDTPLDAREEQHVDLKTMVGLIIAQAALEKSAPIRSMNHKSSAGDDYHSAREAMIEFQECRAPREGESDILREARTVSFTRTGRCGLHAARNFALIASVLHRLFDDDKYHALRDYLPHVEKMVDDTAGKRLGGPPEDDHGYVRIAGMADPVVVDSWVLFPKVHLESEGKYEGRIDASYQVTVNKHDVPSDFERQLNESEQNKSDLRGNEEEMRGRSYWRDMTGTPLRGWQVVQSQRDDAKETVFVCGELRFDPDLMSASGLQLRKKWAQEATAALALGGEQSPIRGAPRLSPLGQPEPEVLRPNASESIAGDTNPNPHV